MKHYFFNSHYFVTILCIGVVFHLVLNNYRHKSVLNREQKCAQGDFSRVNNTVSRYCMLNSCVCINGKI